MSEKHFISIPDMLCCFIMSEKQLSGCRELIRSQNHGNNLCFNKVDVDIRVLVQEALFVCHKVPRAGDYSSLT